MVRPDPDRGRWESRRGLNARPGGATWLVYSRPSESSESYDIFYRTSSGDGQAWSEIQPLATGPLDEYWPSIVRTATGRLIVAYFAAGSLPGGENVEIVYYTISDDDGDTWSDRIALTENSGKVGETDLAVTSQGDIWVVYNSCQEFCGIHYRTSADNGDSWSPETLLEADVYSPSIASSGQELMIAFSRQDCSPITCDSDIWYTPPQRTYPNPPPSNIRPTRAETTYHRWLLLPMATSRSHGPATGGL